MFRTECHRWYHKSFALQTICGTIDSSMDPNLKKKLSAKTQITNEDLKAHPVLKAYFGYCLYKAAMRLRSEMDQALEKHGLIAPQVGMLRLLETLGPTSQVDLGSQMSIDKASMVKFIDNLEQNGLITRSPSPHDRRINLLQNTKKGSQLLSQASACRTQIEDKFLEPLNSEEKRVLLKAIPKLLK